MNYFSDLCHLDDSIKLIDSEEKKNDLVIHSGPAWRFPSFLFFNEINLNAAIIPCFWPVYIFDFQSGF